MSVPAQRFYNLQGDQISWKVIEPDEYKGEFITLIFESSEYATLLVELNWSNDDEISKEGQRKIHEWLVSFSGDQHQCSDKRPCCSEIWIEDKRIPADKAEAAIQGVIKIIATHLVPGTGE